MIFPMLGPRSSDNDREAFAHPASKNFQNKLTKLVHSVSVADTILTHTSKNVGQSVSYVTRLTNYLQLTQKRKRALVRAIFIFEGC